MSRSRKTHDVFLSYPTLLATQARDVAKRFADAGLVVFDVGSVPAGGHIIEDMWQALAESWAVVILVGPGAMPPSLAVEIGAASAWHKPLYVLTVGAGEFDLPVNIPRCEIFDVSRVGQIAESISSSFRPLGDNARQALISGYRELGVPTDNLLRNPVLIDRLRDYVRAEVGISLSGERIMQELLRLRKQSKLPRLQR